MREKERMSPSRKKVTRLSSKLALFDFLFPLFHLLFCSSRLQYLKYQFVILCEIIANLLLILEKRCIFAK